MSTRRHCDVCDDRISSIDSTVTIQLGGMAGVFADAFGNDDLEMCSRCWNSAVEYIRANRKADA